MGQGRAADEHVELALQATEAFEVRFLSGVGFPNSRDRQATRVREQQKEFVQPLPVTGLPVGGTVGDAVKHFGNRKLADEAIGQTDPFDFSVQVEVALHQVDADVGVEQVASHRFTSRGWSWRSA